MDAFDDNFEQSDVDPAAEFLAKEKDQLAQLAGLEDELEPAALSAPVSQLRLDGTVFFFVVLNNWAYICCAK